MTKSKRAIATDLKKLDTHVVGSAEYDDAPELTDEQLARADLYEGGKLIRRGRPPSPTRKVAVKLRIDPDVVEGLRKSGPGWQTRVNAALRALLFAKTPKARSKARTDLLRIRRKAAKRHQQPKLRA